MLLNEVGYIWIEDENEVYKLTSLLIENGYMVHQCSETDGRISSIDIYSRFE